jgi:hypothetical protein
MSASHFSSFAIDLEGYDTDEVLSPPTRAAQPKMKVKRQNETLTSPRTLNKHGAALPTGKGSAAGTRQRTPALAPDATGQQPCSTQRVTRAREQAASAARAPTPSVDAPTAGASGRKRGRESSVAVHSRELTPAGIPDQENCSLNLRRSGRMRGASAPPAPAPREGSAPPAAKKRRGPSKSPAPTKAVAARLEREEERGSKGAAVACKAGPGRGRGGGWRASSQAPAVPPQQDAQQPGTGNGTGGKRKRAGSSEAGPAAAATLEGPFHAQQAQQAGDAPAAGPALQQASQQRRPAGMTTHPSASSLLTSRGPQRSESMLESILKSPSPPRRADSVRTRPISLAMQLAAAANDDEPVGLPQIAAFRGEQPAVDQPLPAQQQPAAAPQQQPAPQAAAPTAPAPPPPHAQQWELGEGGEEQEGRGESPALGEQPFPQRLAVSPGQPGLREGRLSISPAFRMPHPPVQAAAGAAAPVPAVPSAAPPTGAAPAAGPPVAGAVPEAGPSREGEGNGAGTQGQQAQQQQGQQQTGKQQQQQIEDGLARRQSPRLKQPPKGSSPGTSISLGQGWQLPC